MRRHYPWPLLHVATENGPKEIAELLIAKGADVNAKNVDGEIPFDWFINTETAHSSANTAAKRVKNPK